VNRPLIVILGPTGTGKSRLAVELALEFKGEIINGDSRQVYRYMDIGTAKPTSSDRKAVSHHLYDIVSPDEDFSLAQYQQMAYQTIDDILKRGSLPILVGGSGQYIWAVVEGWQIPRISADPDLRRKLESIAKEQGIEALFKQLQELDPVSAEQIDPRNVRRVVRALEVTLQSGQPFSRLRRKVDPGFNSLIIGLTTGRAELYNRVDVRVDEMIKQGLEEEARSLIERGYDSGLPAMNSIGYTQIGKYLSGMYTLDEIITLIKNDNHRFVRHQYAWFRLKDGRIHWLDIQTDIYRQARSLVEGWLKQSQDAG
jgi:tRNA dimethylallyltransferase